MIAKVILDKLRAGSDKTGNSRSITIILPGAVSSVRYKVIHTLSIPRSVICYVKLKSNLTASSYVHKEILKRLTNPENRDLFTALISGLVKEIEI